MEKKKKEYVKGDLTIEWQPDKCIHSALCVKGLPGVFNPNARPWIQPDHASTKAIKDQIDKCPSGALSYKMKVMSNTENETSQTEVTVIPGGPLIVMGTINVKHKDGTSEIKETRCALCRCGASNNKPFCDGTHKTIEFDT